MLLTGDRDGYYADFGEIAQLAKAFRRPHVDDGNYSPSRGRRFGARADDIPPERFIVFDQDHDQVGNRALGDRLPVEVRPLAALCTLLSPFTPMLLMGEEHGEAAPFQFFSDHIDEEIAVATREGRRREFAGFAEFAGEQVPDPQDPETFRRSKLTRAGEPEGLRDLYGRLLAARRAIVHMQWPVTDERHETLEELRIGLAVERPRLHAHCRRGLRLDAGRVGRAPAPGRTVATAPSACAPPAVRSAASRPSAENRAAPSATGSTRPSTARSAPARAASATPSSPDATARILPPSRLPSWTARCPMAPLAPWTSRVSPLRTTSASCSPRRAVMPTPPITAACDTVMPSGTGATRPASTQTYSA